MKRRARSYRVASLLLWGSLSGVLTSAANAADLDLSDDEKSNVGGDSSDDDAAKSTNQRDNDKEELDLSRLENFILDDSDDDPTEQHDGSDGSLAQLIKTKQETSKSVWMSNKKAYLLGRLWCSALL